MRWLYGIVIASLFMGVLPIRAQDCQEQIVLRASVDNSTPYVGEQVIYTVRIENTTRLESLPVPELPSFEGFWLAGPLDVEYVDAPSCNGFMGITIIRRVLFPLLPGPQVIPPGGLDFAENAVYEATTRVVSEEVALNVQPLPQDPPESFTGAVGFFDVLEASIVNETVSEGEPLEVRVTVAGQGNIEQLDAPTLDVPTEWRVYAQASQVDVAIESDFDRLIGTKQFEWLVFPDESGTFTFPPVEFSYFNPNTSVSVYQPLRTDPITITINPNPVAGGEAMLDIIETVGVVEDWAIKTDNLVTIQTVRPLGWGWWLLSPLLLFGAGGYRWYGARQVRLLRQRRRELALRSARSRLARVTRMKGDVAYQALLKTILIYFGDRWEEDAMALDVNMIRERLFELDIDIEDIHMVVGCIGEAQEQRYAPTSPAPLTVLTRKTLAVLTRIDTSLQAMPSE